MTTARVHDPSPLASLARWNRRAAWLMVALLATYLACRLLWPGGASAPAAPAGVAAFIDGVESLSLGFMFAHGFVGMAVHGPWPAGAERRWLSVLGAAALTTALLALPAWGAPPRGLLLAAWGSLIAHAAVGLWQWAGRQPAWRAGARQGARLAIVGGFAVLMGALAWVGVVAPAA